MSDLQFSLLIIGAVVVGVVYLFNHFQERKLRRKLEQAFTSEHDDVLLESQTRPNASDRIEPQIPRSDNNRPVVVAPDNGMSPAQEHDPESRFSDGETETGDLPAVPGFDPAIDCIVQIDAEEPIADTFIGELMSRLSAIGKPVRGAGFNAEAGHWEQLDGAGNGQYATLRLALQLVNRGGVVQAAQLVAFCDLIRDRAGKAAGVARLPDIDTTLDAARKLDDFCADVDVAIGVNIISNRKTFFSGTQIRGLAEAAGFKLESEGMFYYRNNQRQTLFTLDNHEPAPFIPEQIRNLKTTGITLLLDVPRVAGGPQVLDRMLEIGKSLEQALGGTLVDDNRVPLNASGIAKIRQQLGAIQEKMDAHGISAGSERALRLFS
jgi:FtsZ-interacting cell division protein ZipA